MHNKTEITKDDNIPIGKEIAIFRILLNCTQQQFADSLLLSRMSINKLEKYREIEEISPDIAFRLYYATQKILENTYKEDYIRDCANGLNVKINAFLQSQILAKK